MLLFPDLSILITVTHELRLFLSCLFYVIFGLLAVMLMCHRTVTTTSTIIDGNRFSWDVLIQLQAARQAVNGK